MAKDTVSKVKNFITRGQYRLTEEEYLKKLIEKGIGEDGHAIMDSVPLAPPIGYKEQPSMIELVRNMIRGERLRQEAMQAGFETMEEADDFDIEDDPEPLYSGYENDLDPPMSELMQAGREEIERKKKDQKQGSGSPDPLPRGERREGAGAQEDGAGPGSEATEPRSS